MPIVKRPKRGSRAFYPRVRASRLYPKIKSWPVSNEVKPLGFAGYKAGMTHVMVIDANPNSKTKGQLISRPVTILDCPSLHVFGFKAYSKTSYGLKCVADIFSEKFEKHLPRKINIKDVKPLSEQLKRLDGKKISEVRLLVHTKPGFKKKPEIFEIALGGESEKQVDYAKNNLGKEIKASDILKAGESVDIFSVSKGKGFEGPVKRFGIHILGRKHQQMARHVGSHGQKEPGKVRSTIPQAGQHGFQSRPELNKKILKVSNANEVNPNGGFLRYGKMYGEAVILEGSITGPTKRLIRMRMPIRPQKHKFASEVKSISLASKQGV